MGKVVRSLRDRKNPYARYMEQKRLKRMAKQELQYLKCIMRDGHFFRTKPRYTIDGMPIFVTGEFNYTKTCKGCGFSELTKDGTGRGFGIPVPSLAEFRSMVGRKSLHSTSGHKTKKKLSPEEKVEKWRLKTKGFKK